MQPDPMLAEMQEELEQPADAAPEGPYLLRLREFVALENHRRQLEFDLEATEKRLNVLKPQLIEDMAEAGVQNTRIDGLSVFTRLDWWVHRKPEATNQEACEALRTIGRGDMVVDGHNAASLKALVLEWKREEQEVPPILADKIDIGSKVNLVTRR